MKQTTIMDLKRKLRKKLSETYTIMLLSHSSRKPVQLKAPVWIIAALGLFSAAALCFTVYLGTYTMRSGRLREENEIISQQLKQLEEEKQIIADENGDLKKTNETQKTQLSALQSIAEDTVKELESLHEREYEIRRQAGLDVPESEAEQGDAAADKPYLTMSAPHMGDAILRASSPANPTADSVKKNLELSLQYAKKQEKRFNDLSGQIAVQSAKEAIRQKSEAKKQLRDNIVAYALHFVGNPYIYGGNDPNSGVDCSGFTRYVLSRTAGISLNRTAASQSRQGTPVDSKDARPGDLVFYGSKDHVSHVGIYIGEGKIVHASSSKTGIIVSNWNYRTPVRIVNMLGD